LSRKQMQSAYSILTSAEKIINGKNPSKDILDFTNQFYTLIPHNFGFGSPPLLDNHQIIRSKTEMLQDLMEIEHAYNILSIKDEEDEDILDSNYKKLNCEIKTLSKASKQFKMIQKYVSFTHASTHNDYELEVDEVFQLHREGLKFKNFKISILKHLQQLKNNNLKPSRAYQTTNYCGTGHEPLITLGYCLKASE